MKIGLIDPCVYTDRPAGKYYMPMGLLSIAATAEMLGHTVELVQLSQIVSSDLYFRSRDSLTAMFSGLIADKSFDIVGFTTRCDTLPLVIEVAKQHRSKCKETPIIFGGPGATFVDRQILEAFPFVDVIVRGEGEETFVELTSALQNDDDLSNINGITFRETNQKILKTPNRKLLKNLDDLPEVALHLVEGVLNDPELWWTDVLVGRGCPNSCRFCSTCAFWGRVVRMRSPKKVVAEMKMLNEKYGIRLFSLIHDNILAHKKFMQDFCKYIQKALPKVKFGLSASLNFSSPKMIKLIARSGCTDVFVGIETASDEISKNIPAKFCPPAEVQRVLNHFTKNNIKTIKSYIIGFPDETHHDISQTLMLAIETQASEPLKTIGTTQIHPLSIHPGTKLYNRYRERLLYNDLIGDLADPRAIEVKSCLDMCKHHPAIFTSYASFHNKKDYSKIIMLCNFYRLLAMAFPKSTYVAIRELELSPIILLERFREHILAHEIDFTHLGTHIDPGSEAECCLLRMFPQIVKCIYKDTNFSQDFIRLFLNYEQPRTKVFFERYEYVNLFSNEDLTADILSTLTPIRPRTTTLLSLSYDPDKVFSLFRLRNKKYSSSHHEKTDIVYYLPRSKVCKQTMLTFAGWKMNRLLGQLTLHIMQLADGSRTCSQIVDETEEFIGLSRMPAIINKGIWKHLRTLVQHGILMLSEELRDRISTSDCPKFMYTV